MLQNKLPDGFKSSKKLGTLKNIPEESSVLEDPKSTKKLESIKCI